MEFVDWCIVQVEIPLTRFEECRPLPKESLAELLKDHNILHIVLLKCPQDQIEFLKFTNSDNQALVGCIPILAVAVHLNLKS